MIEELEEIYCSQLIPDKQALRQFLDLHCQKFTPPKRDFTLTFGKQVLEGSKKLFSKSEIIIPTYAPRSHELSSAMIFKKLKGNENTFKIVSEYLPNYPPKFRPNRLYLLSVLNTVFKHSITNLAKFLRKKKFKREMNANGYLQLSNEFIAKLQSFQEKTTHATHRKKKYKRKQNLLRKPKERKQRISKPDIEYSLDDFIQ